MVDYIRGKKTYTKWDTDTDNIDIEYLDGSVKVNSGKTWFSGIKGNIIKVLLMVLIFSTGLILGYFIKKGVYVKHESDLTNFSDDIPYKSPYISILQQFIQPNSIKEFLRHLSERPHVAGTLSGAESATVIQRHWETLGLGDVRIEKYNVLLSFPSQTEPSTIKVVDGAKNILLNISNANSNLEIKPYYAYSPSGKVRGRLVFANYGQQEDFLMLQRLNLTIKGAVILIKLGLGHIGDKVRWAAERGASGVLLYPDPIDYVGKRLVVPHGIGLNEDGVVYGSLKTFPGDPLTPRIPSIDSAYRTTAQGLPIIPAQPISYNNAEKLFKLLGGPEAPSNWTGDLNVTYRLGGEFEANDTYIEMDIHNELVRKDIFNVIGVLHSYFDTDEYVIIGAHHDSWTSGASDPVSGLAILMELVKSFSQLAQTDWKPRRSIVFASWDAEEFGIIGSTEWVEDHFKELTENAVAYINIDSAVTGNNTLHALGSPLLQKALIDAANWVNLETDQGTVFDQLHNSTDRGIDVIGTGSDFVSFMGGYGIPSMHMEYVENDLEFDYPLFHTEYDAFDTFVNHVDPSFQASTNLARLLATMILTLTESLVLPFNCDDYVVAMEKGVSYLKDNYREELFKNKIDLEILEKAIAHFKRAANLHSSHFAKSNESRLSAIQEYNNRLMQVERTFILPRGVRDSNIYRHAIFGPHPHDLRRGVIFPGIIDSILHLQNQWTLLNITRISTINDVEAIKEQVFQVVHVIRAAGNLLINSVITHLTAYSFL